MTDDPPTGAAPGQKIRSIDLSKEALTALRKSKNVRSNTVRTSKYNLLTFVPFNLFEQFTKKFANLYFLVIMGMQMITVISISNGQPAMAPPLVFVVVLSMIKDAYEDYKRHKEDHSENNAMTERYQQQTKSFYATQWKNV